MLEKGSGSESGDDLVIEFDDDDDDDNNDNKKNKEPEGNKNWRHDFNKQNRKNNDIEMEITFN